MDQYVDNRQKEILWDILANPANNGAAYTQSLERLVQQHPQSGLLQVLLARTGDKQLLNKASVYYKPRTLYKLINNPGDLPIVDKDAIKYSPEGIVEHSTYSNTNTPADTVIAVIEIAEAEAADTAQEAIIAIDDDNTEEAFAEPIAEISEEPATENEIDNSYVPFVIQQEEVKPEAVGDGDVAQQDIHIAQEPVSLPEPQATEEPVENITGETYTRGSRFPKRDVPSNITIPEPEYPQQQQDIEDDVYDEIVSIEDIGFEAIASEQTAEPLTEARFSDPTAESGPEEEEASAVLFHQPEGVVEPVTDHSKTIEQEDRLILGGIVNTDYLRFDKKLDELRNNTAAEPAKVTEPQQQPPQTEPAAETQGVSRYDDDKMPYTFLWWLNKTRKEHAENLQPYATHNRSTEPDRRQKAGSADELQQQYYENIFSLTSVSGVDREADPAAVAFDPNKKEDIIIERFIHTEPQIKPLSADKLDNENKAKKSSEDLNDFVTETLARIYTDQMLYHKAIATYKKLILKYPEKKLYFAAQIEQLEKKTN
ncbi:hypothetical protein IDJ75_17120 [Mucilaginibacter rigui]|uniref:Tetratricopeptide repeat protein n=1 Tax=Mucilaginibacter rigui TaxID=534635 RepID=A0ABR7X910_9SPHI|nr:hypothetical protein [Mucilaginibacter rigui]MBD1387011.1 hypothetical protein [Mucilaginibacter rigui]